MRHRRAGMVVAAGALLALAAAAAWALAGNDSPGGVAVPVVPPATARTGTPPPPPHGALVLARGDRGLAVALAARRAGSDVRLTATVLAPDGTGLRGLRVHFAVDGKATAAATPCGPGCYASRASGAAGAKRVSIDLSGGGRERSAVSFALPLAGRSPRGRCCAAPSARSARCAASRTASISRVEPAYRSTRSGGARLPIGSAIARPRATPAS